MDNEIIINSNVNTAGAKASLDELVLYAKQTGAKLDQAVLLKINANIANLELKLKEAEVKLSAFKSKGNKDGEVLLSARTDKLQADLAKAKAELSNFTQTGSKELGHLDNRISEFTTSIQRYVRAFAALTIIHTVVEGFKGLISTTLEYEHALGGINKTMNLTKQEFADISQEVINLSKKIPLSVKELAKIGELGGQLGIPKENLVDFTETIGRLGVSVDGISTEEAAKKLAQLAIVTKEPIENIDQLASVLVRLGNNTLAQEGPILSLTNRLQGAGEIAGFSAEGLLGIAAGFSSLGVTAEGGGTAISKAILEIDNAISTGSASMDAFALVSGKSSEQFKKDWEEDAEKAFLDFIKGLQASGKDAVGILEELIGSDARLLKAFLSAAGGAEVLEDALAHAKDEMGGVNALMKESDTRFAEMGNQITIINNRWKEFGVGIGNAVLPFLVSLYDKITNVTIAISKLIVEMVRASGQTLGGIFSGNFLPRGNIVNNKPEKFTGEGSNLGGNVLKNTTAFGPAKPTQEQFKILKSQKTDNIIQTGGASLEDIKKITGGGGGGGGGSSSKNIDAETEAKKKLNEELEKQKELEKKLNEELKYRNELADKGQSKLDDYYDNIIKKSEEAADKVADLTKELEDLNKELVSEEEDFQTDLAERKLEILERQNEIKQKGSDITGEESQELQNIINELGLLDETLNATGIDTFKELEKQKGQSVTERLIDEFDKTKEKIDNEIKLKQEQLDKEQKAYEELFARKKALEENYTTFLTKEVAKREAQYEKLISAALRASQITNIGSGTPSTTNVNNTSNNNITQNINSNIDLESVNRENSKLMW